MEQQKTISDWPLRRGMGIFNLISGIIVVLLTAASLAGLINPSAIYPTEVLKKGFISNDVVNLGIGLPILLGSMLLANRKKWIGLLFWPGALFFVSYTYLIYSLAMPVSLMLLVYLTLAVMSGYAAIALAVSLEAEAIAKRLKGAVPERLAGGILAGLSALFMLRVVGVIFSATQGTALLPTELGQNVADFIFMPAWILGGVALWRHQPKGYAVGLGLLFQGSMLFIGLIMFYLLQPILTTAPFAGGDVLVVAVMGCIFFVPTGLFIGGVLKKS
ncbi:MAG TPA: hypothetical protein PKW33_10440 [Anaerolineaceae bacterium]|nr:hypothetical protein [Anaerolineaceae bacterium]HPN51995.1 hypothetical protein [Anaerolineaceae bacterium]